MLKTEESEVPRIITRPPPCSRESFVALARKFLCHRFDERTISS